MTYVFLSPHYDDAIGSCGGTIARMVGRAPRVVTGTRFGGDAPAPSSDFASLLHRRWRLEADPVGARRREDIAASGVLGCRAEWLPLPDAIYRTDAAGEP